MTDAGSVSAGKKRTVFAITALCVLVAEVYYQVAHFSFINLDDNLYVSGNQQIANGLTWAAVRWAFTTFWCGNWHPVTWISHAIDVSSFGMNAGEHHLVNVVLHLVNSLLVFVVFRKMTDRFWASLLVAALFAVHPTHVESVAWVAERKDVLSTMFWLLTMLAYDRFVRKGYTEEEKRRGGEEGTLVARRNENGWPVSFSPFLFFSPSYLMIVALFALGLMAKPMLVTLPCVLLLCDFWPLGRLKKLKDILPLTIEKVPLFALSIAAAVVTFLAQRSQGAVQSLDALPITTRFVNAIVAYGKYIVMFFYPADLAVWYPYENNVPNWEISGSALLLIGLTALCIWQIKKRPFLLFGWLWFLGTLVPVIGIVQVGSQGLADRYTYIPYIGLSVMAVWGASSVAEERGLSRILYEAAALVAIITLTIFAHRQVSHWQNNETLYRHALAVTTNNHLISHNLCHDLMLQGRLAEAEPLCQRAVDISPGYAEALNTLGIVQMQQGKYSEAEKNFSETVKYAPDYAYGWLNLAHSQALQHRPEEADTNLQKAIELTGNVDDPVFADTLYDLAIAYTEQGDFDRASENFRRMLVLMPDHAEAHAKLALSLYHLKQFDDAQAEVQNALTIKPELPEAWNTLGLIFVEKGQNAEAVNAFEKAISLKPDYTEARENLAHIKSR